MGHGPMGFGPLGHGAIGHGARRWLAGLGGAAVAGVTALSLAPIAGASVAAVAGADMHLASGQAATATAAQPGSFYVPSGRTLTFGMHGNAVKALQERLNYLHYYAGQADGNFGWDTM